MLIIFLKFIYVTEDNIFTDHSSNYIVEEE